MKEQKQNFKNNFLKKIFIKICRIFGFEIIDQSNFYVPTQEKILSGNLSIQGNKSINLPLGEIKISRKINSFTVVLQNKQGLFGSFIKYLVINIFFVFYF